MADSRKVGRLTGGQVATESEALRSEQVWSAEAELAAKGLQEFSRQARRRQTPPLAWLVPAPPLRAPFQSPLGATAARSPAGGGASDGRHSTPATGDKFAGALAPAAWPSR